MSCSNRRCNCKNELEDKFNNLKNLCVSLCDDINSRYPDKPRNAWRCDIMAKIADLVNYGSPEKLDEENQTNLLDNM